MTSHSDTDKETMWQILEDGPRQWIARVQEDSNGEQYLVFPPEMLTIVDWHEGDTINWSDNGDGSFTLTKA